MFQERLSTPSIRYIKSDKLMQTNCNEPQLILLWRRQDKTFLTVYRVMFNLTWFEDGSSQFLYTYFNNDSISEI